RAGLAGDAKGVGREPGELELRVVPEAVALVERAEGARIDEPGQAAIDGIAERLVATAEVDDVVAPADRLTRAVEGREPLAVVERRGEVLQGGVDLAIAHRGHRVRRAVESDDLDVVAALLGCEGVGGRLHQYAHFPFA